MPWGSANWVGEPDALLGWHAFQEPRRPLGFDRVVPKAEQSARSQVARADLFLSVVVDRGGLAAARSRSVALGGRERAQRRRLGVRSLSPARNPHLLFHKRAASRDSSGPGHLGRAAAR